MQEYIGIAISFIVGGGLTTLLTARYLRKNSKIETEDKEIELDQKVIDFWKKQYNELLELYQEQKKEIEALTPSELKKETKKFDSWFNDQFQHPLESVHTFDEVLNWFSESNIKFCFSLPSTDFFDKIDFNATQVKGNFFIRLFKQFLMLFNIWGKEGGLFIFVGRK
jgi:hypothetical protein